MKFKVELNGTNENPFVKYGLTQNPFPQIAKAEYAPHLLQLAALGGEPIPDKQYIRDKLAGWSEEFVNLCCDRFILGEMVVFEVHFKD